MPIGPNGEWGTVNINPCAPVSCPLVPGEPLCCLFSPLGAFSCGPLPHPRLRVLALPCLVPAGTTAPAPTPPPQCRSPPSSHPSCYCSHRPSSCAGEIGRFTTELADPGLIVGIEQTMGNLETCGNLQTSIAFRCDEAIGPPGLLEWVPPTDPLERCIHNVTWTVSTVRDFDATFLSHFRGRIRRICFPWFRSPSPSLSAGRWNLSLGRSAGSRLPRTGPWTRRTAASPW